MKKNDTKERFEANMLDGEKVEDCGKAMLSAESVWEYIHSERTRLLNEVRKEVIGEDEKIKTVHDFYQPIKKKAYTCPRCGNTPTGAYDYSGGQLNGRNELRVEQRIRLTRMEEVL